MKILLLRKRRPTMECLRERGEGFVLVTSRKGAIRLHKSGSGEMLDGQAAPL